MWDFQQLTYRLICRLFKNYSKKYRQKIVFSSTRHIITCGILVPCQISESSELALFWHFTDEYPW